MSKMFKIKIIFFCIIFNSFYNIQDIFVFVNLSSLHVVMCFSIQYHSL
ncbi:hypothetical protein pb186bvf_004038 [Paramecium bursaria]